jgi:hypothetical protein
VASFHHLEETPSLLIISKLPLMIPGFIHTHTHTHTHTAKLSLLCWDVHVNRGVQEWGDLQKPAPYPAVGGRPRSALLLRTAAAFLMPACPGPAHGVPSGRNASAAAMCVHCCK